MMPCSVRPLLRSLTCLLIGWIWFAPALAESPAGSLYDAEVPIQGQSPEQRNEAIENALRLVLGRLFGGEKVSSDPRLAEVIKSAPRLARSYRFRWDDAGTSSTRPMLVVQFDEAAVNRTLREKGVSPSVGTAPQREALPATRPTRLEPPPAESATPRSAAQQPLLLWLARERSGLRDFATPEADPMLVSAARAAASQQGVPVLFPLYDLEDRTQINAADLWALRMATIQGASRRYAADQVLVGLVSGSDRAGWSGQWVQIGPGGLTTEWTSRGASPEAVVQAGVRQLKERGSGGTGTSARSAAAAPPPPPPLTSKSQPGATTPVTTAGSGLATSGAGRAGPAGGLLPVQVSGVQRWEEYLRTQKFLASLSGIGQVQVLGVAGDQVTFGVGPGTPEALSRAIASGGLLVADERVSGAPAGILQYRLQP